MIAGMAAAWFVVGAICGWIFRPRWESRADRKTQDRSLPFIQADLEGRLTSESAVTKFQEPTAILRMTGEPLPTRKAWGEIPYEELTPMFLDQFLLRYFYSLMATNTVYGVLPHPQSRPWADFVSDNPWAQEMPLLFEQMTGYKLNDHQLNNAIAEWDRRSRAARNEKNFSNE